VDRTMVAVVSPTHMCEQGQRCGHGGRGDYAVGRAHSRALRRPSLVAEGAHHDPRQAQILMRLGPPSPCCSSSSS